MIIKTAFNQRLNWNLLCSSNGYLLKKGKIKCRIDLVYDTIKFVIRFLECYFIYPVPMWSQIDLSK